VTVKLKGYDFFFHREQLDFVLDPGYTPFYWKRKGEDAGNDGQDNDGYDAPTRDDSLVPASMDVDKPQDGNSNSHDNSVSLCPSGGTSAPLVFAITPINPNPSTPRAKEIVEKFHSLSPVLLAAALDKVSQVLPSSGASAVEGRTPGSRGLESADLRRFFLRRRAGRVGLLGALLQLLVRRMAAAR
jgi:hypothetical protein